MGILDDGEKKKIERIHNVMNSKVNEIFSKYFFQVKMLPDFSNPISSRFK